MEPLLIALYAILGIYYLSGIIAYINIYLKNNNRGQVYLNAVKLNRETEIDSIIENSFGESSSDNEDGQDLSYAGY
jgi:hypothetical protein